MMLNRLDEIVPIRQAGREQNSRDAIHQDTNFHAELVNAEARDACSLGFREICESEYFHLYIE